MPRYLNPAAVFWSKVHKTDSCWLWTGDTFNKEYGRFGIDGRQQPAHRVAWQLTHGPIPEGLFVCHNCPDGDNPLCVNPEHLFLGTHVDNMADKVRKGRASRTRGERSGTAKLTQDRADEIRHRHARGGVSRAALAREYGVSQSTISAIILRRRWQ
ncbi:MAG TPA: HNH endonuclease [Gemmatimonadaceae bacterium]